MSGKVIAVSQNKNREYEELNGRCPNCGAKLPEAKGNVIQCEYCDSRFVEVGKQNALKDNYINMIDNYYKVLAETQAERKADTETLEEKRKRFRSQYEIEVRQWKANTESEDT